MDQEYQSVEELLDRIREVAADERQVSLQAILEAAGYRSFGPILLAAGLITLAPLIGDIPGVPTLIGLLVFLNAIQLLFRRKHFWLPRWLLDRSVETRKLFKALNWMRTPARWLDRLSRPRFESLTQGAGLHIVAFACLAIAITMPLLEVVPFSANLAGAALTLFGLGLTGRDGLMSMFALAFTVITFGLLGYSFF